ncbi:MULTISPECIES: hypothetical protein [Mycobacterium]|uniref:DUF4333 domain-containing protein n=1 Tax=Mycobacterium kiyosense TaxID=2871094 RepID=A0A9P3Q2A6_9MYCO|nr:MULTISPECIES: hypothetical protein [Mycobacterium]BDB42439.1 hypothetical protein IWGMT90018_28850 [Mycobacterium kiyosense]BDE14291.1 hypothetical protein MKCMC460_31510 [Mycobacterium sp. 20KCMC460]GLB81493.1 hypothetical protein SRL2020028_07490 [Mycobacterium kiyosense]GLB90090.1 hypothetical protein SRL2020130_29070 [Mycobacterium kiyosense]GLB93686.1 hypothetical protein SRL2020226_04620 [Mycobacterium kiyosense]
MWPGLIARVAAPVVLAAASTLVVGGCGGAHQGAPGASSTSSSIAAQPNLVDCANVKIDLGPMKDQQVRCVLTVKGMTLEVSSDPAWSFSLRDHGGAVQQFSEPTEEIGETGVVPLLQDIDNSGTPVLLVVTGRGGTGGEPMAAWRLTGSPARFVRAGELFGFRRFFVSAEGFFGNYAHSSAIAGTVTLYRWVDDKLTTVAVLDTQAAQAAPDDPQRRWVRNGDVLCALSEDDYPAGARAQRDAALRAAGMDPATAQDRFCTQPWVASIYR